MAAPVVWIAAALWLGFPAFHKPLWPVDLSLLLLMQTMIYPTLEELVFRGLLQGRLIEFDWGGRQLAGISVANMLTTVVFSLLHLVNHAPQWALAVIVPSLVFGYFRDRYNGWIIPSIALHCYYNTGYFLIFKAL
ncbi:MAG: JDVT-CTERM system glutamic-type intramembrane protease [Mariprofundaceae bacterium]